MAIQNQSSKGSSGPPTEGKRRLLDCYQRADRLSTLDKNYDYAHALFAACVLADPGNLQFVEAMVRNLRVGAPKRKKSLFTLRGKRSRQLTKAVHHKAWPEVLRAGIERLKANPWDVMTLRALAEACAALHYNEVELVYLRQALDAAPKDVEVNRHCARSLGRMGQFDQAVACWHRIETLKGKDEEASQMISLLAQEKLLYPGGRPPMAPAKAAQTAESLPEPTAPVHEVVVSPQQRLERAIEDEPQNVANYLELADVLLTSNRFDAAEKVLRRALAACGEQLSLQKKLERARYMRAEEQRMLANERVAEDQLRNAPARVGWLELSLVAAAVVLGLQLIPSVRETAWKIIDFTNWSQLGWIAFNILVLCGLAALRFKPQLQGIGHRRRAHRKYRSLSPNR